jgi:hypothetical protein
MKTLRYLTVLFIISIITVTACKKEEDDDNNNNNNTVDKCKNYPCKNGSTCNDGVCICTAEWTGKYCDTSAILTPFFKAYRVYSPVDCIYDSLDIAFVPREKETNPLVANLYLSIGCNYGGDRVVRLVATFDGNNFTTQSKDCVYNTFVEARYFASGYFTTDSIYMTLNSTFPHSGAPGEICNYSGKRPL